MRKILYLLVAILITLTSCEDWLSETPKDFLSEANYYTNATEAEAGVMGIYDVLQSDINGGWQWIGIGDCTTDLMEEFLNWNDGKKLESWTWTSNTGIFSGLWKNRYTQINRANDCIEKVAEIEGMDEVVQGAIIGEAKFLRALAYFDLVRCFGDIPVRTEPIKGSDIDNPLIPRMAIDSVYSQIFTDLGDAVDALSKDPEYKSRRTRVSQCAAYTLLAKAYLQYAGYLTYTKLQSGNEYYQKAEEYCNKVINEGDYDLFDNYAKAFYTTYKNGVEHIFSVNYSAEEASEISNLTDAAGTQMKGTPYVYARIYMRKSYRKAVPYHFRKEINIADSLLVNGVMTNKYNKNYYKYTLAKYFNPIDMRPDRKNGMNFPLLRYSDVLLMKAEARSAYMGAPDQICIDAANEVRARALNAYYTDRTTGELTSELQEGKTARGHEELPLFDLQNYADHETFMTDLLDERAIEFVGEAQRRFDLIRNGRYVEVCSEINSKVKDYHELFPIPQREMNLYKNMWEQNPGY